MTPQHTSSLLVSLFARSALALPLAVLLASPSFADQVAVSNIDEFQNFNFNVADLAYAQSFTTSDDETTLASVTIAAKSDSVGTSRMNLRADNGGLPGVFIKDLGTLSIPTGESSPTFTPDVTVDLLPNTTYWLTIGEAGAGSGSFCWRGTTSTDQVSSLGWTIADQILRSNNGGLSWIPVSIGGLPTESGLFSARVEPVEAPDNILVTRSQTAPVIDSGPLSFGLAELPSDLDVTFLLGSGFPTGGGATGYGLNEVISTNVVFGDGVFTELVAFDLEIDAKGAVEALSATFAAIDTPSVSDGSIVLNSPAFISGTDVATGQQFSYTYADSVDTITAVPPPGNNVLVTRRQTLPVIDFGPLSFGLAELPAELDYTVLLRAKSSDGATEYGLDDVIFANIVFGDGVFTEMTAFAMEIEFDGTVESMSATFAAINTPTVFEGPVVLNSPAFISGTDIASGLEFSYTYTESVDTVMTPTFLGDVNLDCQVNLLDVAPFVDRISTGTFQLEADINEDGAVNLLDVGPLVDLLSGE